MSLDQLRESPTMERMLTALEHGEDIGHYGRLAFAMAAHFFLERQELLDILKQGSGAGEEDLMALVQEVEARDYNPPSRRQLLEWQEQQEFQLCPGDDPDGCNLYQELDLPERVFEHIKEYRAEQFEREAEHAGADSDR
jgi:hypothetical protein